jgi:hypothetical protein
MEALRTEWNENRNVQCPTCISTERFKKSVTTLKAYINLFRGHVQCFEVS